MSLFAHINIAVTLTCRLWWRTWWGAVGGGCCRCALRWRRGAPCYPTAWCWGTPAPPWGARAHQRYNPPAWDTETRGGSTKGFKTVALNSVQMESSVGGPQCVACVKSVLTSEAPETAHQWASQRRPQMPPTTAADNSHLSAGRRKGQPSASCSQAHAQCC